MALINFSNVSVLLDRSLKTMAIKEGIEVKTFKKDRGLLLHCTNADEFTLIQFGFDNRTVVGDASKIKKAFKKALQKEFPRSNKAWVEHLVGVESPFDVQPHHKPQMSLF